MTGFTARWFLGVDDGALSQSLEHSGVLTNLIGGIGRLSGAGSSAVGDEVAGAVGELLDVDLGKVLVDGWRTGTQLRDAARETVAAPGTSAVVELARHRVNAAYRPHVDLLVDGRPIGSLKLELSLVFDVHSMQATVRAGRLVGLRCGRCDLTAALLVAGQQILAKTDAIEAPVMIPFGHGISLLPSSEMITPQL